MPFFRRSGCPVRPRRTTHNFMHFFFVKSNQLLNVRSLINDGCIPHTSNESYGVAWGGWCRKVQVKLFGLERNWSWTAKLPDLFIAVDLYRPALALGGLKIEPAVLKVVHIVWSVLIQYNYELRVNVFFVFPRDSSHRRQKPFGCR